MFQTSQEFRFFVRIARSVSKKSKLSTNSNVNHVVFPHHSHQMSQRSQVSRVALCVHVKITVTHSVTTSQIEQFWPAKTTVLMYKVWNASVDEYGQIWFLMIHWWWCTQIDQDQNQKKTFPAHSDLVVLPKTLLATSCWVAGRKTPAPRWRRQYFSKSLSHPALPFPKIFFTYSFHRSTSPAFCFKNGIRDACSTADSGLLVVC